MKSIRCSINEHAACMIALENGEYGDNVGCDCPCHTIRAETQSATAMQMLRAHCAECEVCRSNPMSMCLMGRTLSESAFKTRR